MNWEGNIYLEGLSTSTKVSVVTADLWAAYRVRVLQNVM